jgi:UDP-N-acetylmuramate dehydrogenase
MDLLVQHNVSLKDMTTLKVGGSAVNYVAVDSELVLNEAVSFAKEHDLAVLTIGGGSNILVSSKGVDGLVIHMKILGREATVDEHHVHLTAYAGELLDDVVQYSVSRGYWGLENLSHIPGTVGASPVQNVGAYGVEVKDCIESVRVYNTDAQKFEVLTAEECAFGYRDSLFKKKEGRKYIVVAVTFLLTTEVTPKLQYKDLQLKFSQSEPSLAEIREAVIEIRSKKFPNWNKVGTAGSFFKNPVILKQKFEELLLQYPDMPGFPVDSNHVKIPLGWVLDKVLHLKGEGTHRVGAYQGQALVLINKGDATADDIVAFADDVLKKVHDAIGVEVEWEVTKIGF